MDVHIHAIPAHEHRYPTVGDWWQDDTGAWHIRVTRQDDWRHEFLIALHEQIEMALCAHRGIDEQWVTAFDVHFESARTHGQVEGEPGDAPAAPYTREHRFAENIERLVAHELDVVWANYEATIENS